MGPDTVRRANQTHTKFPNGGSWSYFRCPKCGARSRKLRLVDDAPRCRLSLEKLCVRNRAAYGFGRTERLRERDRRVDNGDGTVARRPGGDISPEDREPLVAVGATAPRLESPTPSDPSASDARTLRSKKRIRRPAEKHARFDPASSTSADVSETAPMIWVPRKKASLR